MEMFYLVLSLNTTVVMPEKYTKEQCEAVSKSVPVGVGKLCIPAPKKICKPDPYSSPLMRCDYE